MKSQRPGRRRYSLAEAYRIDFLMFRSLPAFRRGRKAGLLSAHFAERLMLAVTEVNQCAMCSYAHTKMALESGMDLQEIEALLAGNHTDIDPAELPAILFAQHYAESRGKPSAQAWNAIVGRYGQPKSYAVLGAIRMMMVGNLYGIPLGSLLARFSHGNGRKPDPRSSLGYELALLLTMFVFIPGAALHALAASALGAPVLTLRAEKTEG